HFVRFRRLLMRFPLCFAVLFALTVAPLAVAQTANGNGAITLGVITQTKGNVALKSTQGVSQILKQGQAIRPGSLIQSSPDSNMMFAFPDGQIGVLGQNGAFRLNDYAYDPKALAKSDLSMSLIEGAMRVVMGEIGQGNPSALRLQVGTASVL